MTRQQEIEKLNEQEMIFNAQCAEDHGRFDETNNKIHPIKICAQCPHYEYKFKNSYCRGKIMYGKWCTPNTCLKAVIDDNTEFWSMTPEQIQETIKEKITEVVNG
jgi:hypothetical protein